jgi:hypothetical protein
MASSTIQLQRTINYAQQFIRLSPLVFALNTANDPAFSNADYVLQMMLAPPFAWRWNRANSGSPSEPLFSTIIGTTDYSISLPEFGWLEKATIYDPNNGYKNNELGIVLIKSPELKPNQPTQIATQYDDGEGNITFRVFPAPDKVYNVVIEYQKSAQLFTSPTQTWAPVPDYLSYIYNEGFFAKACEYTNDPRFQVAMQFFLQDLTANAEGLTDSQKNLWLEPRLASLRQTQNVQQGRP